MTNHNKTGGGKSVCKNMRKSIIYVSKGVRALEISLSPGQV